MTADDETPGTGDAGGSNSQVGTGPRPILQRPDDKPADRFNVPEQLRRRRLTALQLPALDSGNADPLDACRLPEVSEPCSRGFACLAQSILTLQAARHCPCVEATAAVGVIGA